MARYKLILAYDGTRFAGSQRQADKRTVQGCLEEALRQLGWAGRAVGMAGRTDAGVHASGQVASFDLAWTHGDERLRSALNATLPPDMAVSSLAQVPADFHPRYDAVSRTYLYRVICAPTREPLRERYAWRIWPPPDLDALVAAASAFLGDHDFRAFGTPSRQTSATLRNITRSSWSVTDRELEYLVTCGAFLFRMVRRMVFVQVAVAQGRTSPDALRASLATGALALLQEAHKGLPAGLAPPRGLTLVGVAYDSSGLRMKRRVESVQDVLSEGR